MTNSDNVFISHASEDKYFVDFLADMLEHHEINTWHDKAILPGNNFNKEIDESIRKSNSFIVVLTEHSEKSDWVKREVTTFLSLYPDGNIIPIVIAPACNPDTVYDGLNNIQYIDFRICISEGFKTLLSQYNREYLINFKPDLIDNMIEKRQGHERRKPIDRRSNNFATRVRWDCWNAYNNTTHKNKQDQLELDNNDELEIINALYPILKKHKFMKIGHQPLDCKTAVVGKVTHKVVEEMRQQKIHTAIHTIHGIADKICNQFHIEPFERRQPNFERRISSLEIPCVSEPIRNQRTSERKSCHAYMDISTHSGESITIEIKDQSREGIGFISSKKLQIREVVHAIKSRPKQIAYDLSKQYFITREHKTPQGYFYGAQAIVM